MNEEIKYPETCPKCKTFNINVSDYRDANIITVHIQCRECEYTWVEKIDLEL